MRVFLSRGVSWDLILICRTITAQKRFSNNGVSSKCDQIRGLLRFAADLVTLTEEILNGKLQEAAPLEPLAHCQNIARISFYSIVITLTDVHLNWMSWFYLLILVAARLIILKGCIIFLSSFLDVIIMSMSTVSFLAHLDPGILCQQSAFLWAMI